jgi:murein DD-endopeptidase MepM/ murein hydrolase activator NlpD
VPKLRLAITRLATIAIHLALCAADPARDATPREGAGAVLEARVRRALERLHWSPESVDLPGLLAVIDRRLAQGEPPEQVDAWVGDHLVARWFDFAPLNPAREGNPLYQLPFDRRVHWIVSQGIATQKSHDAASEFAIDFAMPEGTRVLAARRGTVVRVVDGFTQCCLPKERRFEANTVIVLHPDGTWASYVHLRQGVPAHEGQKVQVGDLLGYSGSTGFSELPHLHFQVSIRRKEGESRSIPVHFRNGRPGGYLPAAWRLYENRTQPRASLRVSLQDRQLSSGQAFEIAGRESLQLRVERVGGPGEALDVTRDPRTSYVALTPWSLRVDRGGRVEFEPSSDQWKALPEAIRRNTAIVTILFRDDDGKEGYFDAWFRFAGAPGAGLEKP